MYYHWVGPVIKAADKCPTVIPPELPDYQVIVILLLPCIHSLAHMAHHWPKELFIWHYTVLSLGHMLQLITYDYIVINSSVSSKRWYHGAPPSFNLKVYFQKHCFTTLTEHCWPDIMYPWCTPPPLIFILRETLLLAITLI